MRSGCWLLLCLTLGGTAVRAQLPEPEALVYRTPDGKSLPYRLAKPVGDDGQQRYPLLLYLHGAGERGDDNVSQLKHATPVLLSDSVRKRYPGYLVAPQCPADRKWTGTNWQADHPRQTERITETLALVLDLVADLQTKHRIDPKRIYVTGVSMGASATWDLASRRPELFAAAVPICGGCHPAQGARLAKLPLWAFQGAKDEVVKPDMARRTLEAIRRAGGDPKYTEYPDRGHDIWRPAYQSPSLLPWLFAQKRE
jgi:predicted peptidase